MFGEKILNYWDDIMNDCKEMIAIPSVASEPDGIYVYGKDCAKAIDFAMELSEKYGLKAKNVDYYACHAEIGEGEENAVVMAHLDVVPEGDGWIGSPYDMQIRDGSIVGRGIADDKGSAIVALHCLRVLKDEGVIGKRKLRVVMGSGEEVGMKDMVYYFDKEQKPTIGFTPDSEYGVCNCEKGHIIFKVTNKNESSIVKTFDAGTVVNAVPYKAEAVLSLSKEESEILENATKVHEGDFEICAIGDDIKVISHGTAAHASTPEHGKNAASLLIDLLYKVFGEKIGKTLVFAKDKIGLSYDGSNFSMKCSEEYSGDLTLNLGIVKVDSEKAEISVDIRFPKNKKYAEFKGIIENAVSEYGLELEKISGEEAIYISADCPLVEMLTGAYKDITGEECDVFAMGGGTYAKAMGGKGVAFGPSFQDDETHIHDCNEKINLEKFKIHAQICLESMYRMFTIDEV